MRNPLPPLLRFCVILLALAPLASAGEPVRKVLLIGFDGILAELVQKGIAENFFPAHRRLVDDGAFITYAVTSTRAANGEYNTLSAPNWTSILTGVEYDVHGVASNRLQQKNIFGGQFHSFTGRKIIPEILSGRQIASSFFAGWLPLAQAYGRSFSRHCPDSLRKTDVYRELLEHLAGTGDGFVFWHLGIVDKVGHNFGFGIEVAEYRAVAIEADGMIAEALRILEKRTSIASEHWRVFIATDHGGVDTGHRRMTLPVVFNTYLLVADLRRGEWRPVDPSAYNRGMTVARIHDFILEFLAP